MTIQYVAFIFDSKLDTSMLSAVIKLFSISEAWGIDIPLSAHKYVLNCYARKKNLQQDYKDMTDRITI